MEDNKNHNKSPITDKKMKILDDCTIYTRSQGLNLGLIEIVNSPTIQARSPFYFDRVLFLPKRNTEDNDKPHNHYKPKLV